MVAHWQMCGAIFLMCALALTTGEEEAAIETKEETAKEDLNPEASSRLFGFGLDNFLHNKFGGYGGFGRGYGTNGYSGYGGGVGPGGVYGGGGYGGYGGGYGGYGGGYGGYDTGYGSLGSGYGGYGLNSGYGGYGTSGYGGYGNAVYGSKYRNYGGLGTGPEGYYSSGYGTTGSYGGSYLPFIKKYRK